MRMSQELQNSLAVGYVVPVGKSQTAALQENGVGTISEFAKSAEMVEVPIFKTFYHLYCILCMIVASWLD
jgi:hypothetical protein